MKTKNELISKYAEMANTTKKNAELYVDKFIELIKTE